MAEVLFEISKDHLETGLRGYPVGYCVTSSVDPQKGLFYVGKPVVEFADKEPEEVIYNLYTGHAGSANEVAAFTQDLRKRAECSPALLDYIRKLPREGSPMKLFSASLLLCGMLESTGNYREDCLNIIAKVPIIAATVINHHAGWGGERISKPELGYIENFTQLLNLPGGQTPELNRIFKLFNILHYDHGGGNLSTFVGKAVASGHEDMYGSLTAAMCGLAGSKHGKANQDALELVKQVQLELGSKATLAKLKESVKARLENKDLIYGFGHAVLRVEDPRATVLYKLAGELYPANPMVKIANLMREGVSKVLSSKDKISNPYPNVDAISGTLLTAAGFPYPEYYTILFGLSRVVGISIQIVYERCEARDGKGTPIVRPKYYYKVR